MTKIINLFAPETKPKDKKKNTLNSWINKLLFGVTLAVFVIAISFIGVIVALYFFVMFVSQELGEFIRTIPTYHATLGAVSGVALAYIYKRFK
jgi:predicted PurR-regulated permease PerM